MTHLRYTPLKVTSSYYQRQDLSCIISNIFLGVRNHLNRKLCPSVKFKRHWVYSQIRISNSRVSMLWFVLTSMRFTSNQRHDGFLCGQQFQGKDLNVLYHTIAAHIVSSYMQILHSKPTRIPLNHIQHYAPAVMDVNIFFVSHFECPVLSIRVLYCVYTKAGFRILKDGSLYSLVFSKSLVYATKKEMARGVQKTRQCGTILLQVCRTRKRVRMGGADGLRKNARLSIMLSHLTDEK